MWLVQPMELLIVGEGYGGFVHTHVSEAGSTVSSESEIGETDESENEAGGGPSSLEGWISALHFPHLQLIPHEVMKTAVEVMWYWARLQSLHISEMLILQLRRTVVIPYCSILMFLLCRVVVVGDRG